MSRAELKIAKRGTLDKEESMSLKNSARQSAR